MYVRSNLVVRVFDVVLRRRRMVFCNLILRLNGGVLFLLLLGVVVEVLGLFVAFWMMMDLGRRGGMFEREMLVGVGIG